MLIENVSPFAASMKELRELFEAEQPELDLIEERLEDIIKQFYVKTATWSIEKWENDFLIEHDSTLSIEQRWAMILAKINSRTTATIAMLENMVKQITEAKEVIIQEKVEDYSFIVFVFSNKLASNIKLAKIAVYMVKPAHLGFNIINKLERKVNTSVNFGVCFNIKRKTCLDVINEYVRQPNINYYVGFFVCFNKKYYVEVM